MIARRNPTLYQSATAFSPVSNPVNCPRGKKAFIAYLGADSKQWLQYDTSELMTVAQQKKPILVDQGDKDHF